jgi:hypothetical protein
MLWRSDATKNSLRCYGGYHLGAAQRHLEEVLAEARAFGIAPDDLPAILRRPDSTLAKLVDEFAWVTVTCECRCPDQSELERWLRWAKGK